METYLLVKEVPIQGNLIDNGWIKNLRYPNGKENINAVLILSEIVYWYRPAEVIDKISGKVIGYKKKFKADKLQKSYEALGEKFGLSRDQAKRACDFLREKGVITIEFRNVKTEHRVIPNVMFVELMIEKYKNITGITRVAPDEQLGADKYTPNMYSSERSETMTSQSYHRKDHIPSQNIPITGIKMPPQIQKITTETTTKEPPPTSSITLQTKSEAEAFFVSDEKLNESANPKSKRQKNQTAAATVPYNEIVASYHEHCPSLPRVLKVTDARKKQIAARWKDNDCNFALFTEFFQRIEKSDFLTNRSGANRNGWSCTFDWALNDQNMTKILEGRYDNKIHVPVQTQKEPQYSGWGPIVPDYVRQLAEESAQRSLGRR